MLKIVCPVNHIEERKYIYTVLFREYLGLNYNIYFQDNITNTFITYDGFAIEIQDVFFNVPENLWLKPESLPNSNVVYAQYENIFYGYLGEKNVPIIFGNEDVQVSNSNVYLGVDIFGSCFFMLSRYEEYVVKNRDKLDRFDYKDSYAYKNGFLDRPIVNEYVELLWCAIKSICPTAKRRENNYQVIPTHDIDKPFGILYDSQWQLLRHFVGDIFYKRGLNTSFKRLKNIFYKFFLPEQLINQGNEIFDFIIQSSKKYNLNDVFFFMNSKLSCFDGNYYVDCPSVKALLEKVIEAGHQVGIHPSYDSYLNPQEIRKECIHMANVLHSIPNGSLVGGRQHYLRWNNPMTWQAYEFAGLKMDSTLTFAGHVGFRCGVCYPYTVYDVVNRKPLNVKEMPLIVMDGTLFEYMHLSQDEALEVCKKLSQRCRRYNGDFVFLWHNTMLYDEGNRAFYAKLLECVVDGY